MVVLKLFLVLAGVVAIALAEQSYKGFKVYDVMPSKQVHLSLLQHLAAKEDVFDFFSPSRQLGKAARIMVNPKGEDYFLQLLQKYSLSYEIVSSDMGEAIKQELEWHRSLRALKPYSGHGRLSTERYYTHDEINSYIEDLAVRYPLRVYVKTFGKSYEGRLLKTLTITNGDGRAKKNVILVDGGFHAREWISPAAVLYMIDQLVENYSENSDLLLDYDWVILPVVNADGYEYTQLTEDTRLWRKTRQPTSVEDCYGADPNRNFDFHWNESGASDDPCSDTYAGPKAFSESEARVVRDIMHTLKGRGKMYLTMHSYGQYLLYPWGWTSALPDTWEDLHEVAQTGADVIFEATGTDYTVGSSTNVLYVAAGASDDYAFYSGFPISFTMELPRGGQHGFDPPPESIDGIVTETWLGVKAMAQKVIEKYPLE